MIVDGRLAPGARIGQAELADALGISRGSVREALRRLAGDGLVAAEVNRGFFVANVGLEGVLDRLEARLLLEPQVARLAAARRDDGDLASLRRAIATERAARTAAGRATRAGRSTRRSSRRRGTRRSRGSSTASGSPMSVAGSSRAVGRPDWQASGTAERGRSSRRSRRGTATARRR